MEDLYEKTDERSEQIKKAGYNLMEMWEYIWTKSKEYKEEIKRIEKEIHFITSTEQCYDDYLVGYPIKIFKPSSTKKVISSCITYKE
ncbi:hypothetical protein BDFB_014070 [Asbolus verrucosus]|uniref:Uncharacterized protein n=1 Tax=Asbolus verrucosus TaxID=1661398 RepID=A0A482W548_ASBVE|nr:hypothetical protein BDFB_014070 [Asbolus verrucosus]